MHVFYFFPTITKLALTKMKNCVNKTKKRKRRQLTMKNKQTDRNRKTRIKLLAVYSLCQATMKELETAYNSLHKPKLYFELEKSCSPDVKKILLPKLKGNIISFLVVCIQ